ncbi:MAG: hypothetical protein HYX60_02510, partial [Legionella longbeachae]|nr:hypothetical protein [Legionella longbeachae]
GFLVTISGVSVLAYTTSGIVLDDHHFHTQNITQKLKEGIFGIAEVLELTISALDSIRKKLAEEVEKFKEENIKLTNNITQLNQDVETLSYQVELYVETEKLLRRTQEELEKKAESLTKDLEKQSQLIVDNQNEIQQVKTAHEKIQLELSKKVSELSDVREKMGIEVNRAKKIASTLEGTVKSLSNAVISDSNQRHAFHEKLNIFLTDKTNSFDQVAERINKAEIELVEVKHELKNSNERYKQLLKIQEKQIRRLEGLDKHVENSLDSEPLPLPSNESLKSGGLLNSLIMSIENSIDPEQHPTQNKEPLKTGGLLNALSFLNIPQKWIGVGKSEHTPEQAPISTEEITPNTQSY